MNTLKSILLTIAGLTVFGVSASKADMCGRERCCPKIEHSCDEKNHAYLGLTGSCVWHNKMHLDNTTATNQFLSRTKFETGFGFGIAAGYAMPKYYLRTELELLYRRNAMDTMTTSAAGFSQTAAGTYNVGGWNRDLAILANVIIDIPVCSGFNIFAGGGCGISFNQIQLDRVNKFTPFGAGGWGTNANDDMSNYLYQEDHDLFAWNALAGISYDICESVVLSAGYRVFGTTRISFNDVSGFRKTNTPITHGVDVGLRLKF